MAQYKITKLADGRISAQTPYHPEAVQGFKNLMGRWDSVNRVWLLRSEHEEKVKAICDRLWPDEDTLVERVYRFEGRAVYAAPTIDGLSLVRFWHDWVGRVLHPNVTEIVDNTLRSGGSMKHPNLSGTLVVRVKVRPEAQAEWLGGQVSIDTDQDSTADRLLREALNDR